MYNENFIKGGAPVKMLQEIIITLVIALVCIIVTAVVTYNVTVSYMKKSAANTIGNAEEKAREIIDEALKTAEAKKRESLLEIKEESIRTKNELDKEIKERRAEVQRDERRVQQKEANIDKKADAIERREQSLAAREESLNKMRDEVSRLNEQRLQELERISGLTSEQAKDYLLKIVEDEVKHETAVMIKEMESQAKEEADKKAKEYVVSAIQRCAADHVSETTISVVQLPGDEMKGRIIGREGRNIRTLETLTGVDLIIDDTPEAVILSGFDPIRREVARIALEKLIVDGRIHPARIEEMVEKAQKEVEVMIKEEGEAATLEVGVHGIHPELVRLLGKMKFRTSYGQNALKHSIEVAHLSGLLASELGLDVRLAKRAGLLHDIGKSVDHEMEGSHVQLGAELCRKYKENAVVVNAVESHHGDVEATSLIACIVQAADTISAARPGARRETLETYTSRLRQLEEITNNFKGVEKSYAIQAGREVRVMVVPEQVTDADMVLMARDISKQIEAEMEYPGQIKVNVIRESRVIDYAK
jgi:ribonuclease Y